MPKVNIKTTIINKELEDTNTYKAIINDNKIKYQENDVTVVFDYNNKKLIRENNDYKIEFFFEDKLLKILIKELDNYLEKDIKVEKIHIKNNNIKIEYKIDEDKYLYSLEVIE